MTNYFRTYVAFVKFVVITIHVLKNLLRLTRRKYRSLFEGKVFAVAQW